MVTSYLLSELLQVGREGCVYALSQQSISPTHKFQME